MKRAKMRLHKNYFKILILYKWRHKNENSRKKVTCNIDVPRESYAKQLTSGKHLENIGQDEMIIPDWLFQKHKEILKRYRDNITLKL